MLQKLKKVFAKIAIFMAKSHAIFSLKEIMSPMTITRSKIVLRPSIDFTKTKKLFKVNDGSWVASNRD